ncbi:peptidase C39 family protein [Bifidobacterium vespertilionis]|nr:peptidase C39 family protein [Bifidobacterium vespertilionis]
MAIRTIAVPLEPGCNPESVDGLPLPEPTHAALVRAGGVLRRTVYAAADGNNVAALLGYHRPHTAQEKLTAIGGDECLWADLIAFAVRHASSQPGIATVKVEGLNAAGDDAAGDDAAEDDVADGMDSAEDGRFAHYRQTTEFTCGPVALLDALHRRGLAPSPTRDEELALWREATIVVACDPYGLALAADRRGARPEVYVSAAGPVLHPDSGLGILDARLARDTQLDFERQVRERGIAVRVGAFGAETIGRLVDDGRIAVVLIDELHMHGEACPHWVTVTGRDPSGALLVDDPWTDADFGESAVDAFQMPVWQDDLDLMIRYDAPRSAQAMLVL